MLPASFDIPTDESEDRVQALEKKLESSIKLIEQLTNRITELEKKVKADGAATTSTSPAESASAAGRTARSIAALQDEVDRTRLRMLGTYAVYDAHDWEAFAEYCRFFDGDQSGGGRHVSHAGFIHAGRSFGSLTPYLRCERASLDPTDVYFNSQQTGRSYTRHIVGSRYALDAKSSVKLELSRSDEAGLDQYDGTGIVFAPRAKYRRAAFQYSVAF